MLPLASSFTSMSLLASPGPSSNTLGFLDLPLSLRNLRKGGMGEEE